MMRREIKAYIEAELRDFNDTLRQIGEERNEILLATSIHDNNGGHSYDISDPTHDRSIKLMTNKRINRMEQIVKAIENVVGELPEDKFRMIELKYWTRPQTLTDIGICQKIPISKTAFYKWKNEVLIAIGVEMGLIDISDAEKTRSFGPT